MVALLYNSVKTFLQKSVDNPTGQVYNLIIDVPGRAVIPGKGVFMGLPCVVVDGRVLRELQVRLDNVRQLIVFADKLAFLEDYADFTAIADGCRSALWTIAKYMRKRYGGRFDFLLYYFEPGRDFESFAAIPADSVEDACTIVREKYTMSTYRRLSITLHIGINTIIPLDVVFFPDAPDVSGKGL